MIPNPFWRLADIGLILILILSLCLGTEAKWIMLAWLLFELVEACSKFVTDVAKLIIAVASKRYPA